MFINKFSIYSFIIIFFNSFNLFAGNVDELVGKQLKFIWDNGNCETTIYDWKEVASNCYSDSYNIETVVQDDGLKYFKWGPILRDNKPSYMEGITYFDDGSFAVLYKEESPDSNWSVSKPKLEISDIIYKDIYKVKKNIYDFQINLLNAIIEVEENDGTPNIDEINKLKFCKNNLPTEMITDVSEYNNVNFKKLNKDLEIYISISQNEGAEESLGNWMMELGGEEPTDMPDAFKKISSLENFLLIFGSSFAYAFGCDVY